MSDCNGCKYYNNKCNLPKNHGCSNKHIVDEIYHQGIADERERIINYLKSYADRYKTERIAIDKVFYMIEEGESV